MEVCNIEHYKPLMTALKETGQKVDDIKKQGEKTIITVSQYAQNKNPAFSKEQSVTNNKRKLER